MNNKIIESNKVNSKTNINIANNSNKESKLLESIKSFFISKKQKNNNNEKLGIVKGIGKKISFAIEYEYNMLAIGVLLGIIIILIVILYRNLFSNLESKALSKVTYYQNLNINPRLNVCSQIEEKNQYRLCDYYIASSYNTPCIGKPHFDYISVDMYSKVLQSGARYIQIPICSKSVEYDTIPVVGTAENSKSLITSFNTLDLNEVLTTIRSYAFKYVKSVNINDKTGKEELALGSLNYPLFIHLQIHTHNDLVLNKAYDSIKNILGSYLLDNKKYYNYPLSLEKLCNLTNKIILISTVGYESSNLIDIVIPTNYCFRSYIYEELENSLELGELNENDIEDYYKRSISFINQKKAYNNLEKIKLEVINIFESNNNNNTSKVLEAIFNNNNFKYGENKKQIFKNTVSYSDLFLMYNMIGLTLIEPQSDTSTITNNPNPLICFYNGCHFISMNYHLNDENMINYIRIFKDSSFILKPSGLRLGLTDENVIDLLDEYKITKLNIMRLNIIPNFLSSLSNEFILLEEIITDKNSVLSHSNSGILKFNKLIIDDKNKYINITHNNVFKVIPSKLSNLNDCINLVTLDGLALTINKNFTKEDIMEVYLEPLSKNINDLQYQTFYPEEGLIKSLKDTDIINQNDDLLISLRVYNTLLENKKNITLNNNNSNSFLQQDFEYYLGFERNNIKLLPKKNDNFDFCTFKYKKVKSKTTIQLEHMVFGGIIINNASGTIYASNKRDINTSSKINILNYKGSLIDDDNKYNMFNPFILRNSNGKLLKINNNILLLDDEANIKLENIFFIGKENVKDEQIVIMDVNGNVLTCNNKGILSFNIDTGNNIGVNKYFNIKYIFDSFNI